MAKSRIHYLLVKATFKKAVTGTQALAEVRNLAALSYEEHYTDGEVETAFKLKATKRLPGPPAPVSQDDAIWRGTRPRL